jgi:hypothetical protein
MSHQVEEETRSATVEAICVRRWRRKQFLDMGFSLHDAQRLAKAGVDLAQMRCLLSAGCPRETAKLILL